MTGFSLALIGHVMWSAMQARANAADSETNVFKTIVVSVTDGETSKPVAGATVTAPYLAWRNGTNSPQLTDREGKAVLSVPKQWPNAQNFSLHCAHSNYATREVMFFSDAGDIMETLPERYAFRLERGVTIGGFVRDEKGEAVRDVEVRVSGSGYTGVSLGSGERRSQEYSSIYPAGPRIVTDAKGFWTLAQFPSDLPSVRIELIRPGGARSAFSTPSATRPSGEEARPVDLVDLRATNAVLTLRDGVTVRGIVVNEAGQPVAGARIREKPGRIAQPPFFTLTNDSQGRFALPHRTALQLLLTVEADGYAIKSEVVNVSAGMSDVRIVLPPAQPLRLHLVGEKSEPVAGAELQNIEHRVGLYALQWTGRTDVAGQLVWSNAPRTPITLGIRATNYPYRSAQVTTDGREQVVKLRADSDKEIEVQVTAVDAGTSARVERFQVFRELQWGNSFTEWPAVTNGIFKAKLRASEFQRGVGTAYRLQVRAESFGPWTSEQIYFDEGDREIAVKIEKGVAPAGIVLQPDGTPAIGAKVILNNSRNGGSLFANRPGEFYLSRGAVMEQTAEDGSFKFGSGEDTSSIIVSHDSGFASLTVSELKKTKQVKLQSYARIEGQVRIGGAPIANERVSIKSPISWQNLRSHHLVFSTSTDADGNFTFTNLPPGGYVLYRQPYLIMGPTTESHRWPLDLKAGETKRVEYTFNGRMVVGHVEAPGAVDWKNDPHILVLKLPPAPAEPNYYSFVDNDAFQNAREEYGQLPAVLEHARQQQQFQLVFDRDGNFRADDVPPGTYEMRLRVTKPPKDRNAPRWSGNQEEMGSLTQEVTVPAGPGDQELDLGSFELPVSLPRVAGESVQFRAVTLDGREFELSSTRGKPAVVAFWAAWAPQSVESLAALRAVADEFAGRATFVSVNLDEDAETARAGLREFRRGWTHARLEGAARYNVTEQFGIDTLPMTLLLDRTGRVFARDVGTNRLRTTVLKMAETK